MIANNEQILPHLSLLLPNYNKNRTHSDDDYDDDNIVLRTKSYSIMSTEARKKCSIDRSFSVPMEVSKDGTTNGINNIDRYRSFLDSDYLPDEYWHLQRDSFIHRSYNEKLLTRKNAIDYPKRPVSVPPVRQLPLLKRDSFIRQSLNTIRRSFNIKSTKHKNGVINTRKLKNSVVESVMVNDGGNNINSDKFNEKGADNHLLNVMLDNVKKGHSRNSSTSSCTSNKSSNNVTLGLRSAPSTPMAPLQTHAVSDTQSISSNLIRSPSHSSTKPESRSNTSQPTKSTKNDVPEEVKKRKEPSSGRQKKFHRHFQQVAPDERVINYFSCALVSDILLQGHLYITDNYFAFYSNVFGFVTKLLIPTVSVVKISKEKTAKIIPNAVGVATADERHVFGSFMSREAAYRLMLSVWRPVAPVEPEIIQKLPDVEISECSIEDDSSSAISGNESPPRGIQESTTSTDASNTVRHRVGGMTLPTTINSTGTTTTTSAEAPSTDDLPVSNTVLSCDAAGTILPSRSTSPLPKIVPIRRFYHIILPDNLMHIGIIAAILLTILSAFLFYKILNVHTMHFSPIDVKWNAANKDIDVYAEVLKWQREMQTRGADEAQIILNSNLEQIARVRKSLETLSILIHDKNSLDLPDDTADTYVPDQDSPLDKNSFSRIKA